jgi:hypothetical protein
LSSLTEFKARVVEQTFSNADQNIKDLSNRLIMLKESFDTGIAMQTLFVSTRTSERVETLGPYIVLFVERLSGAHAIDYFQSRLRISSN